MQQLIDLGVGQNWENGALWNQLACSDFLNFEVFVPHANNILRNLFPQFFKIIIIDKAFLMHLLQHNVFVIQDDSCGLFGVHGFNDRLVVGL